MTPPVTTTRPATESLELGEAEFAKISKLAYTHFGLDLPPSKQSLVAARLSKKILQLGMRSFKEYYDFVTSDASGEALESMVDDLTTNHTSFFREAQHFDLLRTTILPRLRDRRTIDIWTAACSTGEEPYSIAISLAEELGPAVSPAIHVLASDISTRVLAQAKRAVYPESRFAQVDRALLQRYLLRSTSPGPVRYQMKPTIRAMVEFKQLNLMKSFSSLPIFPVIFCRNIMIYFDKPTQQDLVKRLVDHLEPGGYLLIGHSENLNGIDHGLTYIQPATYRKYGAAAELPRKRGAR
jgi:chemotaxis protein methyltransferase CheR